MGPTKTHRPANLPEHSLVNSIVDRLPANVSHSLPDMPLVHSHCFRLVLTGLSFPLNIEFEQDLNRKKAIVRVALVHSVHKSWRGPEYYNPEIWVSARSQPSTV